MRAYIASPAVIDALDVASERVAAVQYELDTVKDTEAALRVTRGLEGELDTLRRKIDVVAASEAKSEGQREDKTSKSDTRPGLTVRPARLVSGAALFVAGAGIMMAVQLGEALADFLM